MLKSFAVTNFRLFEKKVTLDFSQIGNYDYNIDCIKDNCVKTAIMYGDNAGGKSSIAFALFDIVTSLTDNYTNIQKYINYLNNQGSNPLATFEYIFNFNGKDIKYEYKKSSVSSFVSEKLILDDIVLLDYDKSKNENNLVINIPGTETLSRNLEKIDISVLKYIKSNAVFKHGEVTDILLKLFNFVDKMLLFWSLENRSFVGYETNVTNDIISNIVANNTFDDLKAFFKTAGFTDNLIHSNIGGTEKLYIKYPNGKILSFYDASSTGMSSLLLVFYWLQNIKDENKSPSFIMIDEFDAFYHFKLSRYVIQELKKCKCQVIVTTHNTSLMKNDILRPDCYYICSKEKILNLTNSTKKDIKEWDNLENLYKGGTFG